MACFFLKKIHIVVLFVMFDALETLSDLCYILSGEELGKTEQPLSMRWAGMGELGNICFSLSHLLP